MRIAITGGAGFVGSHLTSQFRALGHRVTVFGRGAQRQDFIPYSLDAGIKPECLDGIDLLIHAAWQLSKDADDAPNVEGSSRLFEAAKTAGVPRVVFISSLSTFQGCRSRYGRTKLIVEKHASAIGACSVRLGFVCDDSDRGLSGALKRLARLPVIPLPAGARPLHAIRAEDLAPAFLKIAEHGLREPVALAHPGPVTLAAMMRSFARVQKNRPVLLPAPWRLLWLPLRAAEAAGIELRFRSDSLVSLMNQNPAPDFSRLRALGIQPTGVFAGNDSL